MAVQSETTIWVDDDDEPRITREDNSILIEIDGLEHGWKILLAPNTFPALREAMERAERAQAEQVRDETRTALNEARERSIATGRPLGSATPRYTHDSEGAIVRSDKDI